MSEQADQDQKFTEAETKVFTQKKSAMYKGSIAICVVYGVIALGLVLFALLSPTGNQMLTVQFKMFIITLVIGILVIISIIVLMIATAKPAKINTAIYDKGMCPDYWKLEKTDENTLKRMSAEAKVVGGNVCVRDNTILPDVIPSNQKEYSNTDKALEGYVKKYGTDFGVIGVTEIDKVTFGKLNCNRLYPTALGFMDEKLYPDNQNKIRCEIAEQCGFAWSSVCP